MNTTCPNCSQDIEIDGPTLASLQGTAHFECPTCKGAVPVPRVPGRPPGRHASPAAIVRTHKGMNRNVQVLGVMALLVLGGIAAFLAARNGGNIFNTFNNITNQIIHNSYFTQLITNGVTTEKDLQAIPEIRPYGDGFIGISREALSWEQTQDLAKQTGAEVLSIEDSTAGTKAQLTEWLNTTFASYLNSTLWVRQDGQTRVLDRRDMLSVTSLDSQRKAALQWRPDSGRTTTKPALATKELPFANSLGMQFVPVPGTKVLFCIHETRYKDYAAYSAEVQGIDGLWQIQTNDGFTITEHGNDHPVTKVSWEGASKFCAWLSTRESRSYRLPSEHEWSVAVGIDEFPWGANYPPLTVNRDGNYKDMTARRTLGWDCIEGYTDGFPTTAPVMSFKPNKFGLYDMGGNVWEWCADWWDATKSQRVLRGSCYGDSSRGMMQSAVRVPRPPDTRVGCDGFRIVLEVASENAKAVPAQSSDPVRRAAEWVLSVGGTVNPGPTYLRASKVSSARAALPPCMSRPSTPTVRLLRASESMAPRREILVEDLSESLSEY